MADPLSISASVVALIQFTEFFVVYLAEVRNAPRERIAFSSEISGLQNLLNLLERRIDESNPNDVWFESIRALADKGGCVDQFQSELKHLKNKLDYPDISSLKMVRKMLTWKWGKSEVESILRSIERMKALISLALTDDLRCVWTILTTRLLALTVHFDSTLTLAPKEDTSEIRADVKEVLSNQLRRRPI